MPTMTDDLNNKHLQLWYKKALRECIDRLEELGELSFDDEETACYFWSKNGEMLGNME